MAYYRYGRRYYGRSRWSWRSFYAGRRSVYRRRRRWY